jgi:imidazolonepropionase-like amidohydrolase
MTSAQLVLRNGTALAGPELEETPFSSLAIADGLITGISSSARVPEGRDELDLSGKYVLPGLIDAHVHLDLIAETSPYAHWRRPPLERALGLAGNGLRALWHGITTVRDLGCVDHAVIQYARLADSGRVLGPRVIAAGRWICMTGGHGWEYGREADGEADVRKAVREQIRAGAGVIKLMATGGMSTPGSPYAAELTTQELTAGADEAHKAGLSVAAHAHSPAGIRAALAAGVDSIEHGAFMTGSELEQMRHRNAFLVPTAVAVENVRPGSGIDPDVIEKTEAAREKFHASTAAALSLGIKIAAGTDAGTALNPVGPTLLSELKLYARLGADNRTVLAAATVNAGRLVGQGLGVIDAGRPADMIILDRNPLDSLDALADIAGVISRGRLLNLRDLDVAATAITGTGTGTRKGTASA